MAFNASSTCTLRRRPDVRRARRNSRQAACRRRVRLLGGAWDVKGPHFYLLNVLRKKLDFPNLKRAVREQADLFSPTTILIEDKAPGTRLIQASSRLAFRASSDTSPNGDKIMRLHAQTATIENGFVGVVT